MIDYQKSAEMNGMSVDELKAWFDKYPHSGKRIIAICNVCKEVRNLEMYQYCDLCNKCSCKTDKQRKIVLKAVTGRKKSDKERKTISNGMTPKIRKELSEVVTGRKHTNKTITKMSGENHWNWKGGMEDDKYCDKFNDECKENNREKYDRKCFLCGKTESKNGRRLSVHHEDMNKNQGCDGFDWSLVPLCMNCHGTVHGGMKNTELWHARIIYLRNNIWKKS